MPIDALTECADLPFDVAALQRKAQYALQGALQHGAQADVGVHREQGFSVTARSGDVETVEHHQEKSLTITIYHQQRSGTASTGDLSEAALDLVINKAWVIAQHAEPDPYSGLPDPSLLAMDYKDLALYQHWNLTPAQAIEMAITCEAAGRESDQRIVESEGASVETYDSLFVYANTDDFMGHCPSSVHSIDASFIAKDKKGKQRDGEYTRARDASNLVDVALIGKQAAEKTVKRLGARRIKTQTCPVIFHSSMAKGLLGSFIGAISGGSLYRESSFLLNHLDKQVFPEKIKIYQQPSINGAIGSVPFDAEGVRTEERYYIQEGILKSYVLGSYSARKLGMKTTGNAGGVYNLTISHDELSLHDLCQAMGTGLLITELMGQGVQILTGDYSRGATGFWVEGGEIQYPVEEVTVAGNLKTMFLGLQAVANDIDYRSNIRTGSIWLDQMTIAGT